MTASIVSPLPNCSTARIAQLVTAAVSMIIGQSAEEQDPCRSLLCDSSGIIIAEMAYRCVVCSHISDSIAAGQEHYQRRHMTAGCDRDDGGADGADRGPNQQPVMRTEAEDVSADEFDGDMNFSDHEDEFEFSSSNNNKQQSPTASRSIKNTPTTDPQSQTGQQKGGFVTCAVCNMTKFYQSVQRRYGQFTCMGCAKFFGRFLLKPKKYACPDLGSCSLQVSPRCKACLLLACTQTYVIDEKRSAIAEANRPTRTSSAGHTASRRLPSSGPKSPVTTGATSLIHKHPGRTNGRPARGCRKCAGCLSQDCGECMFCRDKPKFGGSNTLKQKCMNRRCLLSDTDASDQALQPLLIQPTA